MSFGNLFGFGDRYARDPYYEMREAEERRRRQKQELLRQRLQEEEEQRRRIALARKGQLQREQEEEHLLARRRSILERQRAEAIRREWQPVRDWTGRIIYRNIYTGELRARPPSLTGDIDIDLTDDSENRDVDVTRSVPPQEDSEEEAAEEETVPQHQQQIRRPVMPERPATRASSRGAKIPINARPSTAPVTTPSRPATQPTTVSSPLRPTLSADAAATRIQRVYRGRSARRQFPLKPLLQIARAEAATTALVAANRPQMEALSLARTPAAAYEQALNKQISAMDAVLSGGNEEVHKRRKALIQRIERELEFIDSYFQRLPTVTPRSASPPAVEMTDAAPSATPAAEAMDVIPGEPARATEEAVRTEDAPSTTMPAAPEPMDVSPTPSHEDDEDEPVQAPPQMTLKAPMSKGKRRRNRKRQHIEIH